MLTLQEYWNGLLNTVKLSYLMCILMVLLYITNINIVEVESQVPGFGITLLSEKPVKSLLVALVKQKVISGYRWKI